MMKRNKVIVVALCLMMILTAGAGAVSAKQDENPRQAGNSSRYFYEVQATDSHGSGRLMIDLDKHRFVFNGKGFTASSYYSLRARAEGSTDYAFFASGKSTPSENLHIAGMWEPGAPPAEVTATTGVPAISGVPAVYGFYLNNYGWFVAKIASYYSTDNGLSWKESGHTDGITKGNRKWVNLEDLGVPYGALVKIHVIVVAGKDRTDNSRIYQYYVPDFHDPDYWEHPYCYADYSIDGTTGNPELTWFNYQCQNVPD